MFCYKNVDISGLIDSHEIVDDHVKFRCKFGEFSVRMTHASFIHDFAFNGLQAKTDCFLEGKTPDLITENEMIEFTTSRSKNKTILFDKLTDKIAKYNDLAERHGKLLKVIVVSPEMVVSNCEIDQEECNNYIERFLIALNLKTSVFECENLNLWGYDEDYRFNRSLQVVLENAYEVEAGNDFERSLNTTLPEFNEDLMQYFTNECLNTILNFKVDATDFTERYSNEGTRFDYKRVVPVSLMIPTSYDPRFDFRTDLIQVVLNKEDLLDHQAKLIQIAMSSVKITYNKEIEKQIALEAITLPEKRKKTMFRFKCDLTNDQRITMATFGVQAKKFAKAMNDHLEFKKKQDKESFNYEAPTDDIESFLNENFLDEYQHYKVRDFGLETYNDWFNSLKDFDNNLAKSTSLNHDLVARHYKRTTESTIIQYCKFIQALFTEINLSVRENLDRDTFTVKPIPSYNCDVYLKTVGSGKPVFFFIVANPEFSFKQMTVGVKYVQYGDVYVSEWSSVKLRDIENYLSISSTMVSTICYLRQINYSEKVVSQHTNFILLLLLSNKDRDEEIVTLLRYIYMRSVSITDNVTTLTSKLPTCLRSRFNVYQVKKTLHIMSILHKSKPKVEMVNGDRDVAGLIDIFGNSLNFKSALNFCYYGYVVNKTKQTENNQSSKLIDKILDYDKMVNDGKLLSGVSKDQLSDHYHDPKSLSVICHLAEIKIKQTFGENYQTHFKNDFERYMRKQSIINLATIKASAKHELPETLENDCLDKLKKRRPKVAEAIKSLIDEFGDFEHPIELVNSCIRKLDKEDSFNVELFSKDQHAGIREIYVVDIKVRVIQWFVESISRSLCKLFDSETMTNPNMKDFVSQKLTRNAILKLDDPVMFCRSGDASKWSQTQNVAKFYQVLVRFLPSEFHKIIKSILMLWFRKKIYLPASLISVCMSSNEVVLHNESINFIQSIYRGETTDDRLRKNSPYLRIRTGFMQGILHFTSSFFHTVVQEGFVCFKSLLINKLFPETKLDQSLFTNIILQGSDDNSESLIISKTLFRKCPNLFMILVQLKDLMSPYLGIKVSKEKTASCVPFLMEYNSTWELAGKFVMPTIKFIFVANDIPQKQTLIGRQEFYYSLLSNCLEKGATILTCNLIRLAQAEQHYLQLGYLHNQLFDTYYESLRTNMSPALGFFMFEPVIVTSLLGFDFMLYHHSINSNFTHYIKQIEKDIPVQILNNVGYKSIANYTVNKFHYKRYDEIMKNMNLGPVDKSRENINARPEILYSTINDKDLELDLLNLKMNDFSVKESLTSRFSKSEMFSSLVYILSRQVCYYNKEKSSLIKLSTDLNEDYQRNVLARTQIKMSFTRSKQYDEILDEIKPMINTNVLINKTYIQRGSSKIKLLEGLNDDSYKLLDLCKAKWFHIKTLPISDRILNKYFNDAKLIVPWLKDTEEETKEKLNCDSFQLYYYLLNSFKDSKSIKLLDTPGKRGNLKYLISRIADVNKKLTYVGNRPDHDKDGQNRIKSNIKFICDFPYDIHFKIETLKMLIDEYKRTDLRINEKNIATLISDVLWHNELLFMNHLIKFQNDLNLIIFTKPQNFNSKDGIWTGDGVILAKNGSLIYEMHVKDETVEKIAVNDMAAARSKFSMIINTVKELNFKLQTTKSMNNIKLNASGVCMDSYGTELLEVPELIFNLDALKNLNIKIEHERIKIVTTLTPKDLNPSTLLDSLPVIEVGLIEEDGVEKWVAINKIPRGTKILGRNHLKESELSKITTICSLKVRNFTFNSDHKPMFDLNSFAKLFWKQVQDTNKLMIKMNKIVSRNKISTYSGFCATMKLDLNCCYIFRDLLMGRFKSRDEIVKELDTSDHHEETEWNIDIFNDIHRDENFIKAISNIETGDVLSSLMNFDDDLGGFMIDEDQITKFAESLSRSTKGFYLHYSTNDVLEIKLFETLKIKAVAKIKDFEAFFKKGEGLAALDNLTKDVMICLFNVPGKISIMQGVDDSMLLDDVKLTIEDPSLLDNSIQNYNFLQNLKYEEETMEHLLDIIIQTESELQLAKNNYYKYRSPALKSRAAHMIETTSSHCENLHKLKGILINIKEQEEEKILSMEMHKTFLVEEDNWTQIEFSYLSESIHYWQMFCLPDQEDMELDDFDFEIDIGLGSLDSYKLSDLTEILGYNDMVRRFPHLIGKQFKRIPMPRDGGCLFNTLFHLILSKDVELALMYMDMREKLVDFLENKLDKDDLNSLRLACEDNYPRNMLKISVWGDTYCAIAFGVLTNSIIHIRNEGGWTSTCGCKLENKVYEFHMYYEGKNHYEPLIPIEEVERFDENYKVFLEYSDLPQY